MSGDLGLLTPRQWEWLAQALDDATQYRQARADPHCAACLADPSDLCAPHRADYAWIDSYDELAVQLDARLPAPPEPAARLCLVQDPA